MAAHTPSPATRLLLGLALAGVGLLGSLQGQALAQGLPKPSCPLRICGAEAGVIQLPDYNGTPR